MRIAEKSEQSARNRIERRYPGARELSPPPDVQRAIADIVALLNGEAKTCAPWLSISTACRTSTAVSMMLPARSGRARRFLRRNCPRLGDRSLARDVAQALSENPFPIIVPCHRVLAAGGKMGGFSAPGGVRTKLQMLSMEGARYGAPTLFDRLPVGRIRPPARLARPLRLIDASRRLM